MENRTGLIFLGGGGMLLSHQVLEMGNKPMFLLPLPILKLKRVL